MIVRVNKPLSFYLNINIFKFIKITLCSLFVFAFVYFSRYSLYSDILKQSKNKRIKNYLFKSIYILIPFFQVLRKRPLTIKEQKKIFYISSVTPLVDDLIDKHNLSKEKLLDILFGKHNYTLDYYNELSYFLKEIRKDIDIKLIEDSVGKIIEIQYSQCFSSNKIDYEKVKEITYEKGGNSLRLFAAVLDLCDDKQLKLSYSFGKLLQLLDDIFDVYYDTQNNCPTLVTKNVNNIPLIFDEINIVVEEINSYMTQMDNKSQKRLNDLLTLLIVPSCMYLLNLSSEKNNKWIKWDIKYIFFLIKTIINKKKYYEFC